LTAALMSCVLSSPLPKPTLPFFPYTTLFRSRHSYHCHPDTERSLSPPVPHPTERAGFPARRDRLLGSKGQFALHRLSTTRPAGRDRKSTRLNSSHVKSSYAVFCLKKKKKQKT